MNFRQITKLLSTNKFISIFLLSGFFGFCLGLLYAQYQWVIEPAQILTGIVKYPSQNHFYILTMKSWSGLNQMSALFLHLGVSEKTLSFLWSGVAGMVSFQAGAGKVCRRTPLF